MSESFLVAVATRTLDSTADASDDGQLLPTDDALAALELHGPICQMGAGKGVWAALLRERGLAECICYDPTPPKLTYTEVLTGGHEKSAQHCDHTLLLVSLDEQEALSTLRAYMTAGGSMVAHVGVTPSSIQQAGDDTFAAALADTFERHVSVTLPGVSDHLSFWRKRPSPPPAGAPSFGVLDVRLELVDLEAPDWAAPPPGPGEAAGSAAAAEAAALGLVPEIGGRTIHRAGG